eukprot:TRINITY_DN7864_c0_g1_i2.p1 TRINITY_DN7864_c0_g1~~TRINITY_DN7864_c0_g1_i2.p1  ORF type:complete len:429 (+),score=97.43 TRINITY_DN7864_c0_g1_i2:70-1356(+)
MMPPAKRFKQQQDAPPSRVIHLRNLPRFCSDMDIVCTMSIYGPIKHILAMPSKRQALIEYAAMASSNAALEAPSLRICGVGIDAGFSTTAQLNPDGMDNIDVSDMPSAVLLVTIEKCRIPLPFHVIHRALAPLGRIEKMLVLRKSGVQVLVQFESTAAAKRACALLQNAALFEGGGVCRCNYSKNTSLTVGKDSADCRDFSRMKMQTSLSSSGTLLEGKHGRVVMIHHLPPGVNCHMLVNLACLFGNVNVVRMLVKDDKSAESAMVEFERTSGSNNFIKHCDKLMFLGSTITVSTANKTYIGDKTSTPLADGHPSCLSFRQDSHRRRYDNQKMQCSAPSPVLHYFNAPNTFQEAQFRELCRRVSVPEPTKVTIKAGKGTTISGHLAFESKQQAVEAVVRLNFVELRLPDGGLRTLKVSFSNTAVTSLE